MIIVDNDEWTELVYGTDEAPHEIRKEIECNGCDYRIVGH